MTNPLAAFLLARLDEEEAAAVAAGGARWSAEPIPGPYRPSVVSVPDQKILCGKLAPAVAEHIARNSPTHVAARGKAVRRLVLHYEAAQDVQAMKEPGTADAEHQRGRVEGIETALRCIALAYSDHPDYHSGWT